MPNQSQIIFAVNRYLKQKPNIDFFLNQSGICSGLAALHIKYSLDFKTSHFFHLLHLLKSLPHDYHVGDQAQVDDFIIQIEKAFRPDIYSGFEIGQSQLEKFIQINNIPLSHEFNLGLIAAESDWVTIFNKLYRNNRSYYIGSLDHAISLSIRHGKYNLYDPNFGDEIQLSSAGELIKAIKNCFDYKDRTFGLQIRIFAHPDSVPEEYPSHDELHELAFMGDIDINCSHYAGGASDIDTLIYLFKKNKLNYDSLKGAYFLQKFNDLLMEQPKSNPIKNALLRGICVLIINGDYEKTSIILNHYRMNYTSMDEKKALQTSLQHIFSTPQRFMKKVRDYSILLAVFDELNLGKMPLLQTEYKHLKLLTFIHQGVPQKITDFLNQHSQEQIRKQIQCAARFSQNDVLTELFNHLDKSSIAPEKFPTIFNEQILAEINAVALLRLIKKGFVINTQDDNLLTICMNRRSKSIFELYAHSWANQEYPLLWGHIKKHQYDAIDLTMMFGSVSLMQILIFMSKNDYVKRAWQDNIPTEIIQSALITAILCENKIIASFLHEQLTIKNSPLSQDTLSFLYTKGLNDENLSILQILTELNFNVLHQVVDIYPLINLCLDHDDFSLIESCFDKATGKIKQQLFNISLKHNVHAITNIFIQKEPEVANYFLNKFINTPLRLAPLNGLIHQFPSNLFALKGNESCQKMLIKDCFKNKLFSITKILFEKVTWQEKELHELLQEFIQDKNEDGIISLLQMAPGLAKTTELIPMLLNNNLLKPINVVFRHIDTTEHELIERIFTVALDSNEKPLIAQCLNQQKITPSTPLKQPLVVLLKNAIAKGNGDVLELFIESSIDFGIDFKELFLFSCTKKNAAIANQLLAKKLNLKEDERQVAIKKLFGEQKQPALFEEIYLNGYGRFFPFILQSEIHHPKDELLTSIKLYPLKRALKEKNEQLFNKLFTESSMLDELGRCSLIVLNDLILFPKVYPLFEQKYGLKILLSEAIKHEQWTAIALMLEKQKLTDLDSDLTLLLEEQSVRIIDAYIKDLEAHYDKMDVRPALFQLLHDSNNAILAKWATPRRPIIQKLIERIELNMLRRGLDLNKQIYRYSFSMSNLKNPLTPRDSEFAPINDAKMKDSKLVKPMSDLDKLKSQCNNAIDYYLNHRDKTLSFFSYFFDYARGKTRAEHYKRLVELAETKEELYMIEYAMFANNNGKQLKKDMQEQLNFKDMDSALKTLVAQMNQNGYALSKNQLITLVHSINKKINANNKSSSAKDLFNDEITYFRKLS